MKLLSICLPTYNRSSFVINQLEFFKKHSLAYDKFIEILVSDNNSDNEHQLELENYYNQNSFFKLIKQEVNCGLIGNIHRLLKIVETKYVWFVGDDDVLLPPVVEKLIHILNNNGPLSFVFFNHNGFVNDPSNIVSSLDLMNYKGKVDEGKKCIVDIFNLNFTSLMFITACVYDAYILKENFNDNIDEICIEDPLLFSLVCASSGPIFIENEILILDRYANATWKSSSSKIFGWGVPNAIIKALKFQFSRKEVKGMLFAYYTNFISSYLRMLLSSPIKTKIKILKFLGFYNLELMLTSFKFAFKYVLLRQKE